MPGEKKIMKTTKKRWARYALPEGFAERGYPNDSNCHTISKSMMDHKNPCCGYQTTCKQCKYLEEREQQQYKACRLYLTGAARSWLNTLPNDSIGSWGELKSQFTRNFWSTYKRPGSLEEIKSCIQRKDETLRSYIQRWSIIKNSAEDVSDEQAVYAFSASLRRSDLVEELRRTKPRTVLELMEVANRFADGEDAYNNKRGRSPEVDRASRQRRRYHNEDSHTRRNQVAPGYERRDEEGY
jgi:hypothetical protein